jgi:hypothetical protein
VTWFLIRAFSREKYDPPNLGIDIWQCLIRDALLVLPANLQLRKTETAMGYGIFLCNPSSGLQRRIRYLLQMYSHGYVCTQGVSSLVASLVWVSMFMPLVEDIIITIWDYRHHQSEKPDALMSNLT